MNPKPKIISGIPPHKTGSFHDTESCRTFQNEEETSKNYEILKSRFWSVNRWQEYCGEAFAEFKLYDNAGNPVARNPEENDFIRIDIPGPGPLESKGYDWVKVKKISINQFLTGEETGSIIIICAPAGAPGNSQNNHINHFYSEKSTSTFKISRGSLYIKAGIHGRNERPNFKTNFPDKLRNILIALGAMLGISKIQWQVLADNLTDF